MRPPAGYEEPDTRDLLARLEGPDFRDPEIAQVPETVQEAKFHSSEVEANARECLDFLCALAMPTIYEYAFPPKYLDLWYWLRTYVHKIRDFSQLAIGLPRGFSKTTLLKLFCLYVILFTDRKFILIVCESLPKAVAFIADVMDMLKELNIRAVFGDYHQGLEIDRQEKKVFTFRGRTITVGGIGSGGDPRGLNVKHVRPDIMIMDDIQSKELAESNLQSQALERWMVGTLMKAKSPKGCLFIFVANMYPVPYYSILRKLKTNRNWVKFIAGGILANGESLWEELQPLSQLLREYENDREAGHPEIFYAEVLNDETASSNNLIDLSALPELPYDPEDLPAGNFIIIDPATGKHQSDDVAIGYFEVYEAKPVLIEVQHGKYSPGETIRRSLTLALQRQCRLVVCESVAYQATLLYWFGFISQQLGISGIEFAEIYPGGRSKQARILDMVKAYKAGEVFVAAEPRAAFHAELLQFNPLKIDNVDNILDLVTYSPRVLAEFSPYVMGGHGLIEEESEAIEVLDEIANSPF